MPIRRLFPTLSRESQWPKVGLFKPSKVAFQVPFFPFFPVFLPLTASVLRGGFAYADAMQLTPQLPSSNGLFPITSCVPGKSLWVRQ